MLLVQHSCSVRKLLREPPGATGMATAPLDGQGAPAPRLRGPCRWPSAPAHRLAASGTVSSSMLKGPVR